MSIFRFSTHVPAVESMGSQWVYKMLLCNLRLYYRLWRFRIWNYEPGWIYMGRDTTEHIKCVLVSQVWPNCKIRCFFMFGLANRALPTALLPLPILDELLVGSGPTIQPGAQMYSSWSDKCPFSVFPLMYRRRLSLWGPSEYIRCCCATWGCIIGYGDSGFAITSSVESILLDLRPNT